MRLLNMQELSHIAGGSIWSEISKAFGRQGKPFIGRDMAEIVVGAAAAATGSVLGAGPILAGAIGRAAQKGTEAYIDRERGIKREVDWREILKVR